MSTVWTDAQRRAIHRAGYSDRLAQRHTSSVLSDWPPGTPIGPTEAVFVASVSDLPAPSGGVITLDPHREYYFSTMVDIGTLSIRIPVDGARLFGFASIGGGIAGTGFVTGFKTNTSSPAIIVDQEITGHLWLERIRIEQSGTGQILHCTGVGKLDRLETEWFTGVPLGGGALGTLNLGTMKMYRSFFTSVAAGWTLQGTSNVEFEDCVILQTVGGAGNACIDFDSSVFTTLRLEKCSIQTATGGFGVRGLAASANLAATIGAATIVFCRHSGTGTRITGITTQDNGYSWRSNIGFDNSSSVGGLRFSGNAANTTFSGAGVLTVPVGTATVLDGAPRFSSPGSFGITLVNRSVAPALLTVSGVLDKAGAAQAYQVHLRKNNVVVFVHDIVVEDKPAAFNFMAIDLTVVTSDVWDIRVSCVGATTAVIVRSLQLVVNIL
jgi:hypothetical protein